MVLCKHDFCTCTCTKYFSAMACRLLAIQNKKNHAGYAASVAKRLPRNVSFMIYELQDIEQLVPQNIKQELEKTGVYEQYQPTAERILLRETGYTSEDIVSSEDLTTDFAEPYARILTKLASARFSGVSEETMNIIDRDYRRAFETIGRLQKPDRETISGVAESVQIENLIDY